MNREAPQACREMFDLLSNAVGNIIRISESLDRHVTTHNLFHMKLGYVGWRFSGAKMTLDGIDENDGTRQTRDSPPLYCPQVSYEISMDDLRKVPV